MKKSLVAVSVIVVLGAAWTGASWYTGKQIEQHMGEVVDNANGQLKAYLPKAGVKLSYENYQRGLFSSKVRYVLRSDGTDTSENAALKAGEEVAFLETIDHGPFPFAQLKKFNLLPSMASVPPAMAVGVRELAPVLVLFFAAAQFIAYFSWSGMADVIAISGANFLESTGVPPALLFVGFLVLAAVLNVFITSGSAQWALIAPVFIPMFMLMGVSPETTQALYRIADSATNIISPMSAYFIMVLGLLQKYRKDAGVGTMISLTLPISITVFVSWTLFFFLWWGLGIPLGPGTPYTY